jgi:hypothetical protein
MAYTMVRILQRYDRLEYRGDWNKQFHKVVRSFRNNLITILLIHLLLSQEIVGTPGHGIPVAMWEAKSG